MVTVPIQHLKQSNRAISTHPSCLLLFGALLFAKTAVVAFVPTFDVFPPHYSPSSPDATRLSATVDSSLESLTVKELREKVKEVSPGQRGLLSRLKRKSDLVNYLEVQQEHKDPSSFTNSTVKSIYSGSNDTRTSFRNKEEPLTLESPLTTRPFTMPPLPPSLTKSRRDIMQESIEARYPGVPLCFSPPEVDLRQTHHPVTASRSLSDFDVVFVGTASCIPSVTRGVSCTALRINWRQAGCSTWLFDVGECTQVQIQQTSAIRPSRITKIFLTHAHGDHTFGLPGLLCLMGPHQSSEVVEIYGPEGLRLWLRTAIRYSVSRIAPSYRVHEIRDIPMAPGWEYNSWKRKYNMRKPGETRWTRKGLAGEDPTSWISRARELDLPANGLYGEVEGGRDIYPEYDHPDSVNGSPVWKVLEEDDVEVFAGPMSHGIPCLGYVVKEKSRPGRLNHELVKPIVNRNVDALRDAGFAVPMKAMAVIKDLEPGTTFTFPDGTVVHQSEAVMPPRQGRKVVICGDTCNSSALTKLAHDADVVVHEATNAYLHGFDHGTTEQVKKDTILHGHSTPQMAGEFAKAVKARTLVLNHFSSRYKGDYSANSLGVMRRIEDHAMKASGLNETQVAAAWDLMVLPVPQR